MCTIDVYFRFNQIVQPMKGGNLLGNDMTVLKRLSVLDRFMNNIRRIKS